jgi:N-alpha-acetyltransferase 50
MYLHVQVNNEGARKFYEHHGFKLTGIEEKYYKKIEPREAWILELDLSTLQPRTSEE